MFANKAALGLLHKPLAFGSAAAALLPAEIAALLDGPSPGGGTVMFGGQAHTVRIQPLSHKARGHIISIFPSTLVP